MNCHDADYHSKEFVKKAEKMHEAIHLRNGDEALILLDELVLLATQLNRSVNTWKHKFDDDWHGKA